MDITTEVFNMIWTAGFNSGIKAMDSIDKGMINNQEALRVEADRLIKEDAESLKLLIQLKQTKGE